MTLQRLHTTNLTRFQISQKTLKVVYHLLTRPKYICEISSVWDCLRRVLRRKRFYKQWIKCSIKTQFTESHIFPGMNVPQQHSGLHIQIPLQLQRLWPSSLWPGGPDRFLQLWVWGQVLPPSGGPLHISSTHRGDSTGHLLPADGDYWRRYSCGQEEEESERGGTKSKSDLNRFDWAFISQYRKS